MLARFPGGAYSLRSPLLDPVNIRVRWDFIESNDNDRARGGSCCSGHYSSIEARASGKLHTILWLATLRAEEPGALQN